MKIAIGSDHRGGAFKERIKKHLEARDHEIVDVGSFDDQSVDYPDYAFKVAELVAGGETARGVLVCGSGVGMSIAANKVHGVRAALCHTPRSAALSRQHNDANVLALSELAGETDDCLEIVDAFLDSDFEGGRHARRVDKIIQYENEHEKR